MRVILCMFVAATAASASAATASYEVLNQRFGLLVGIGAAGGFAGTISNTISGYDMALDSSGNFVIATGGQLYRVTPSGVNTPIANSPVGSSFVSVAIDASGNYIAADNVGHRIFRVSPNGSSIVPVAIYPTTANQSEDVVVRVDSKGSYIVAEDNGGVAHIVVMTPSGSVTPLTLTGTAPLGVGGLTFDASGNYVLLDYTSNSIYTITPAGKVGLLVSDSLFNKPLGIVRDPATDTYIVTSSGANAIFSVGPTGSLTGRLASGTPLNYPGPVALTNPAGAAPTVTQVLNNYGLIPAAFPNSAIAPGSLFIVKGVALADPTVTAMLQSGQGTGLPTLLNGSSVKVTVGGTTTTPAFYYAIGTQLALVLPSNTPSGSGQLQVTYNNQTGEPFPIQVTASAMGFAAYYGAGVGLGVATDTVTGVPYTYANAIPPGTTVVLWGSGLGADPARDATYLPAAFRIDGLAHIYIGGVDAPIVYQGASGYPGLNQVNVTVPSNVLPGCNVSVVGVTASGVPSNFISLPIGNGPCSDPELGTDGRQLQMLSASGSVYNGSLNLLQATGPGTDGSPVTTNSATASFVDFGWVTYATVTGTVSLGGCIVTQSSGPTLIAEIISPTAGTVTLTGPDGSSSLAYDLGSYSAQLWSGFIPPTGGTFTFSATGGSIGSFNVPVVIAGPPLNWTNQGAAQSVSRSAGLPMAWTGGASNSFVEIRGSSSATAGASYPMGSFSCTVAASAGQFTVPAYVLSALPAGSGGVTVANSNYQTFTAMGLDVGIARAIVSFAVNSSFN